MMGNMGRREQNRTRTLNDIQRATLDLIELDGLEATTVGKIAARAGISQRTFFRYYSSKENAALPGVRGMQQAVREVDLIPGTSRELIGQLLEVCRTCFALEVERNEFRRISRLLILEPALMAAMVQYERELVDLLCEKLQSHVGFGQMPALLAAELATCAWRVAWQSFAKLESEGVSGDPMEVFEDVAAALCAL